jgi:hypothetical protein
MFLPVVYTKVEARHLETENHKLQYFMLSYVDTYQTNYNTSNST